MLVWLDVRMLVVRLFACLLSHVTRVLNPVCSLRPGTTSDLESCTLNLLGLRNAAYDSVDGRRPGRPPCAQGHAPSCAGCCHQPSLQVLGVSWERAGAPDAARAEQRAQRGAAPGNARQPRGRVCSIRLEDRKRSGMDSRPTASSMRRYATRPSAVGGLLVRTLRPRSAAGARLSRAFRRCCTRRGLQAPTTT